MHRAEMWIPSPLGQLRLRADDHGLLEVSMGLTRQEAGAPPEHPILQHAAAELRAYFAGELRTFAVPLHMHGTEFQRQVWQALREIPYGTTTSYAELARRVGRPKAVRAVGAANGQNLIGIIVPCHRVIGADGSLTGYAGGMEAKRWLLQHEGALAQPTLFSARPHATPGA